MTDKNTRKEINAVIKKYTGYTNTEKMLPYIAASGGIIGLGIAADFLLTGGLGTALLTMGSVVGGSVASVPLTMMLDIHEQNLAGQSIQSSNLVFFALGRMEHKLQESFNKVSAGGASHSGHEELRLLADEVEQDAGKLSPLFKIASGGPNGFGTEKYEFMIKKPDEEKLVTLAQALRDIDPPERAAQEKEIQHLKEKLNGLENPKIIRLEKKRINRPGQN